MKKYIHAWSVGLIITYFISSSGMFVPQALAWAQAPNICCSSVLFIPGLEASRLYTKGSIFENQLWEPNRNADVEKLYLDKNGDSVNKSVYTRDIINDTNYPAYNIDIYKTFSDSMDAMVSGGNIAAWKAVPYDWRLSYEDIINNGIKTSSNATTSLIKTIQDLSASSRTGKVTIVAHSNGGLLAKALIQELTKEGKSNLVDNLILIAVPQLGTPESIPALLHGYGQEIFNGIILNMATARSLSENMPSAYNLLPSKKYISQNTTPLITFDSSIDTVSNLRKIYGNTINDPDSLNNFLLGTTDGRSKPNSSDLETPNVLNSQLLVAAQNVHEDLENWVPPSNIAVSQIVGWGLDTVDGIKYQKKTETVCSQICYNKDILDYQPVLDFNGDGVVMRSSASDMSALTYYINLAGINTSLGSNRTHADFLETSEVQSLVKNIVMGQKSVLPDNVTTSLPAIKGQNTLRVSIHSPVSLDLYDSSGNHTGLIANPDSTSDLSLYQVNIPNSYYLPFGEGVYAGVNNSATTTIRLQGSGVGSFTLNIDKVYDATTTSMIFEDMPVLPSTTATLVSSPTASSTLVVDLNGDGKTDLSVTAGQDFDPVVYLKGMESVISTFGLNNKVENLLDKRIENMITLIKKGKIAKVNKKIQVYLKSAKLTKRHHKINADDQEIIITMLNNLLDNIN